MLVLLDFPVIKYKIEREAVNHRPPFSAPICQACRRLHSAAPSIGGK
jgi:hypothetical protein